MSLVLPILTMILLSGCFMGLQELRDQPPVRTQVIRNDTAARLAQCVAESLTTSDRDTDYRLFVRPELGRATVTGYIGASGGHQARVVTLDLQFLQQGSDVFVEVRPGRLKSGDVARGGEHADKQAQPVIQRCVSERPR
jgi:hypothetical protein